MGRGGAQAVTRALVLWSPSFDAWTVLYFPNNITFSPLKNHAYIIGGRLAAAAPLAAAHQRHSGGGDGERVQNLAGWIIVLRHFSLNYCSQRVRIHPASRET